MKKSKPIFLIISILILFIVGKIVLGNLVNNVRNISVSTLDLSDIQDGNYLGEYSISPVYVQVEVYVKNHQITDIIIKQHDNGLGSKAERIINDVIFKQSFEVDTVSGATVSSKCILKAIENAIENSKKEI